MSTILIVDDRPIERNVLTTILGYAGHRLLEAADGAEALNVIAADRPDLVIADILMPTMDGFEFVRRLRADPLNANIRVIFYTASYLEHEAKALAEQCGVSHIIVKPCEPELVFRTVNDALDLPPASREPVAMEDFREQHLQLLTAKAAEQGGRLDVLAPRLAALVELGQQLAIERDPMTLLQIFCDTARDITGAKYAAVALVNDSGETIQDILTSGMSEEESARIGPLPSTKGLLHHLLVEAEPIRIDDITADPRSAGFPANHPSMHSFLGAQIRTATRSYGSVYVTEKMGGMPFNDDDNQIIATLAVQVGIAYENARRYEELQREITERTQAEIALRRYAQRMEILHEIDIGIIRGDSIQILVEATLGHLRQIIPCQQAGTVLFDFITNEVIVFAIDNKTPSSIARGDRWPLPLNFLEEVATNPVTVIDDLQAIQEPSPTYQQLIKEGMRSSLRAMFILDGNPVGVLSLTANTPGFFTAEHQEIASEVANQLAIAIRQLRLTDEIAQHTALLEQRIVERTAELQAAKDRAEAILDNSVDGILLVNSTLAIQQSNEAFNRLFACTTDDYFNLPLSTLVQSEDADSVTHAVQSAALDGQERMLEFHARRRDNTAFDAELSIGFVQNSGFVCSIRDITERKGAEEAVRKNEVKFRQLVEAAPIATVIVDQAGSITLINGQAEILFGYQRDELVGKRVEILIPERLREQHVHHRANYMAAPRVRKMGIGLELFARRKDGSEFPTEIELSYVEADAGLLVIVFVVDITERQQRERQLRFNASLQDSVTDAVISTDLNFNIQSWNLAAERIYGWSAEEVIGKATADILYTEFLSGESQERVMRDFMEHGFWTDEVIQRHKDGHIINILSSTVLFKDENGNSVGVVAVNHDITERIGAQYALRESEGRYRLLANSINDVVMRFLPTFDYLYVSPSSRTILGYEPEELLGRSDFRHIHPEDEPAIRELVRRLMEHPGSASITYRFRHKQGHYIWLESAGQAIVSEQTGEVVEFVFSARDVTDRKETVAALRESEERYRLLANNITDMVTRIDTSGISVYVSPSSRMLLGYEPDELVGKSGFELVHPDDLYEAINRQQEALEATVPQPPLVYRVRHKNGHYLWLETAGQIIWSADKTEILGFITISRDISERKRFESELLEQRDFLQLVVDNVPGLVMVKDREGRFQLVNNLIANIYGSDPKDMIGKTDADFNPNRDEVTFLTEKDRETLASGHAVFVPEELLLSRYYQTNKIPLKQADGMQDRLLIVAADITERKKAEEVLRRAFEQEKELGELKSRFVSMASHEFRTPLATILASAETLSAYRQKMTEDQINHRVNNIRVQVDHLKNIIEDVLQLARIQTGRLEINPMMIDLDGLCRSVIDEFESRTDVSHQLVYSCVTQLREVKLDKKLMRQIINNLVSNAIKYSPGAQEVFVNLELVNGSVHLSVRDEGIGIPEADFKHLFEPFHRASNVGAISGTGLGLSITKEAAELQGGTIQVNSQVGIGTTVIVSIPFSTERENDHDENSGH